jgi:transposase-like protein
MDVSIRQLRSTIRRCARGRHPNAVRYPAAVREAVVALARTRLGQGQSLARVARGVGLSFPTLTTWLAGPAEPALRPVTLAPAPDLVAAPPSTIVLVTPEGFRVEGLDGETLVAGLRSLR